MSISIIYSDIENYAKETANNSEQLLNHIESLKKNVQQMKNVWKGGDSEVYCNKLTDYLTKLQKVADAYSELSSVMKNSCIKYNECDQNSSVEVQKAVDING